MWLPRDKDYRIIEGIIVVEDKEVYNHGGKLLGVLATSQYPRSQAEIMKMIVAAPKPAVEAVQEEAEPSGFSLESFRKPGRPKKLKDD